MTKGTTIYFTTSFDTKERHGIIQEVTSAGYLINGVWYAKNDIQIKHTLLDSKQYSSNELLLG